MLSRETIVYVLEKGEYSDRWIAGIFATLESATAAADDPGPWHKDGNGGVWSHGGRHDSTVHRFKVRAVEDRA